ncbi:MAG: Zn-dependent hydrolase [Acidobacteria bacterium]|nr:Zn-dependent hydrolase [Acidobacteriota bacterium]
MPGGAAELRINGPRLLDAIARLAEIGATPDGGAERLAFTPEDGAGRDLVRSWMEDAGLQVRVDGIGNVIGRRAGEDPDAAPVMLGSHTDTVGNGGRYDGNLGVLAALEVARTLNDGGIHTRRPLEVAIFSNEEGSRYHPDMLGSLVYTGGLDLESAWALRSPDGTRTLKEELEAIGYLGEAPLPGPAPAAYVELHIEQGPVLEAEGIDFGAVTGVQGILWEEITLSGKANHAGTTPMRFRHDAGVVAAEAVLLARKLTREIPGQVATVGRMSFAPGLTNVVPGRAVFTLDIRNPDPDRLQRAEDGFFTGLEAAAEREGVRIERRELARFGPAVFDERVIALVEEAAAALGGSCRRMPSGAGHDAQMMSRVCPTGMVFVPSVGGVSHNPTEFTRDEDVVAGGNALFAVAFGLLKS